jgi:glycosyltransferase involved in cell wall biosynthesis
MDKNLSDKPLVSVCMLTHNSEKTVLESIESVFKQSYTNWELIIVDDISTDNTKQIISKIDQSKIRIFENSEKSSIIQNRNRALEMAAGEYVAILDGDDIWSDIEKLEKQVFFLESNQDHLLVGTQARVIDSSGASLKKLEYSLEDIEIRSKILTKNQFVHSSLLIRKDLLLLIGGYSTPSEIPIWEDYYTILNLGLIGKFANLEDLSVEYRVHENNVSKDRRGPLYHMRIINEFKNRYPNYLKAYLFGIIRMILR